MAKGAKKKKELDPAVEARMLELLAALKSAKSLDEYCRALVAIGGDSEASREAQWRLAPPFRTFGGAAVDEEGVISWSPTHVLVVDEELSGARLRMRRGGQEAAPASSVQPRASNDGDDQTDHGGHSAESSTVPAGANSDDVVAALVDALKSAGVKHGKILAGMRAGGGGSVSIQPAEGPRKMFDLSQAEWAETPAAIARGIVEAMGGEG